MASGLTGGFSSVNGVVSRTKCAEVPLSTMAVVVGSCVASALIVGVGCRSVS